MDIMKDYKYPQLLYKQSAVKELEGSLVTLVNVKGYSYLTF